MKKNGNKKQGKVKKWLALGGIVILGVFILAGIIGSVIQVVASKSDQEKFSPPGKMFGVKGKQMHLNCRGAGSPTVLLDAGLGSSSLQWFLVQSEIAKKVRTCSYDRLGLGWSEPSEEKERSSEQFVEELFLLLRKARISGPYLLVGSSLGGLTMRHFAREFPEFVSGLVLLNGASENIDSYLPELEDMMVMQQRMLNLCRKVAVFGVVRLSDQVNDEKTMSLLPEKTKQAIRTFHYQEHFCDTLYKENEGFAKSAALVRGKNWETLPLVVVSTIDDASGYPSWWTASVIKSQYAWKRAQTDLLEISSYHWHILEDGPYNIPLLKPSLAIQGIHKALAMVRDKKSLAVTQK